MKFASAVILAVLIGLSGRLIDYPRLAGGFKGDEATYVLMAFSLADDADMKYQARDLTRFHGLYSTPEHPEGLGPNGIFIKRSSRIVGLEWRGFGATGGPVGFVREDVPTTTSLSYGKAFAYPLFAAPFARLGGLGGMFLFNVLLLGLCAWLGATFAWARTRSIAGAALAVVFILASVIPVWSAWLTPEIFNVTLVFGAYFLWLYKEVAAKPTSAPEWWRGQGSDLLAAVLIGIATYSKPNHALLIGPLGLLALSRFQIKRAIVIGGVFVASVGAFYGTNLLATGESNYQGSRYIDGRVSCYGVFPFDAAGTPFGVIPNKCDSKVTNESNDEAITQFGIFPTHDMLGTFVRNAYYFVVGRDSGLLPFFFPGLAVSLWFLWRWRESRLWHWLTASMVVGEIWVFLALTPWTWNGDGGPPGNRYFLSMYPLMLFLLPASARWGATLTAAAGGFAFTGAMLVSPFISAQQTWVAVQRPLFKLLPVELTIMNSLPVRLQDGYRARIGWHRETYAQFYFMDENVHTIEETGVWTRGDSSADVVIRTDRPLTKIRLTVHSDIDNTFVGKLGGQTFTATLQPGVNQTMEFSPGPGVWSKGSVVYRMKWTTAKGFYPNKMNPTNKDDRFLGVFVAPVFYDETVK